MSGIAPDIEKYRHREMVYADQCQCGCSFDDFRDLSRHWRECPDHQAYLKERFPRIPAGRTHPTVAAGMREWRDPLAAPAPPIETPCLGCTEPTPALLCEACAP